MPTINILPPVLLAFLIVQGCSSKQQEPSNFTFSPKMGQKIDELVQQYQDIDIFSGVVLIHNGKENLYHKAFGFANREDKIPNDTATRFDIGSMNKTFTKVLILQLVDEGKIRIQGKLGEYLKGFPSEAANKVTVQQLLNHRSGYGGYHTPEFWNRPAEEKTLAKTLEYIKEQPLLFEPGTEMEYSNAGYVILGMIAEAVTNMSYYDLVEERIVKKLNLKNTYLRDKYTVPNRAVGYYKNMRGEIMDNDSFNEIPTPAGGFYSTTSEILKFYQSYYTGDEILSDGMRQNDSYFSDQLKGKKHKEITFHAGGFEGSNTALFKLPDEDLFVVVFANMDEPVAEDLGLGIVSILKGKKAEEPVLPARQNVYQNYVKNGTEYVAENWETLTRNFHPSDPKDLILNEIGYDLLFDEKIDEAIELFELNTQLFPEVANCWDSYGEALAKKGEIQEAIMAYEHALSLNADMQTAIHALEKLRNELK